MAAARKTLRSWFFEEPSSSAHKSSGAWYPSSIRMRFTRNGRSFAKPGGNRVFPRSRTTLTFTSTNTWWIRFSAAPASSASPENAFSCWQPTPSGSPGQNRSWLKLPRAERWNFDAEPGDTWARKRRLTEAFLLSNLKARAVTPKRPGLLRHNPEKRNIRYLPQFTFKPNHTCKSS